MAREDFRGEIDSKVEQERLGSWGVVKRLDE